MHNWSLLPDDHNKWAYNFNNRELYCSPEAVAIREARLAALRQLPEWMYKIGLENDNEKRRKEGKL